MRKWIILGVMILCVPLETWAQNDTFQVLLDSAKSMFSRTADMDQQQLDAYNYQDICNILVKAIDLNPANAEAHYYLGYTYSRINSRDARSMAQQNPVLTRKASEQLELVTKLEPHYNGNIIALDPYSKIGSEWGSLAMSYLVKDQHDSAIWAFREGKARGGFSEYVLAVNRFILNSCRQNAYLFTCGDNYTIPLWYLQNVEGIRPDIKVVDVHMLNVVWYDRFLIRNKYLDSGVLNEVPDTLYYTPWADSTITIKDFSWTVKPSFYDQYILRGDLIFLKTLQSNRFENNVYFTPGIPKDYDLGLTQFLSDHPAVKKVMTNGNYIENYRNYKDAIITVLSLTNYMNEDRTDEVIFLNSYRYSVFNKVNELLDANEVEKAKELLGILEIYADEISFPYWDDRALEYLHNLKKRAF